MSYQDQQASDQIQQLASNYGSLVLSAAQRIVGNIQKAEDIQQEVFLKLIEKPPAEIQSWPAFLTVMTTRMALDRVRKSSRWRSFKLRWLLHRQQSEPQSTPETNLDRQQMAKQLREGLITLKPRDAEIFCLRLFSGIELKAIAAEMKLSENHVSVILNRCQQQLAQTLKSDQTRQSENSQ